MCFSTRGIWHNVQILSRNGVHVEGQLLTMSSRRSTRISVYDSSSMRRRLRSDSAAIPLTVTPLHT